MQFWPFSGLFVVEAGKEQIRLCHFHLFDTFGDSHKCVICLPQIAKGDEDFGESSLLADSQPNMILDDVGSAGESIRIKIEVTNDIGTSESEPLNTTLLVEGKWVFFLCRR